MIKNIIFDWSGVIKDAFKSHLWVVNRIFRKYGLKEFSLEELKNEWEEPFMIFFNKYLPNLTLEEEQAAYREGVLEKDYPKSETYPGIVELIKKIKENGNYVAVITSDLPDSIYPEMKKYGLENIFNDVVVKIHDKTESVRNLIKEKYLDSNNTFIVGDSGNEIAAGKQLRIKTIAVTWGFTTEQKLKLKNPDFTVHNLEELKKIVL